MGGILGIAILIVRRHVPESPRWLFIHGQEDEAERIVDAIEAEVTDETQQPLAQPGKELTVQQRATIPFREIAKVAFQRYPKRAILGIALFVGQAFLYNAVTFDLGTLLSKYFDVASGSVPFFILIFAAGNFLGPFLLGRLFDTVGRKPMIAGTYLVAAGSTAVLGFLLLGDGLTKWSFIAVVGVTFFFASAGASSAYLTVSEIFPMETRALAIAFFFAVGTAAGGITGPLLFGHLIESGETSTVAIGFFIGAGVMALGAVAEILFGVRAENAALEDIATPLSATDVANTADAETTPAGPPPAAEDQSAHELDARIRTRLERQRERDRRARFRPGPGSGLYSPGMIGTASRSTPASDEDLDREIEIIARALGDRGTIRRDELARAVGARYWGPGRFGRAVREAVEEGRARRIARSTYAPAEPPDGG